MPYKLFFTKDVQKQLRKMDKFQSALITRWLYQHIDGTDDPRRLGKGLTAHHSGHWRYRIGNYRVIVDIQDQKMIMLAIQIGPRKNIYHE